MLTALHTGYSREVHLINVVIMVSAMSQVIQVKTSDGTFFGGPIPAPSGQSDSRIQFRLIHMPRTYVVMTDFTKGWEFLSEVIQQEQGCFELPEACLGFWFGSCEQFSPRNSLNVYHFEGTNKVKDLSHVRGAVAVNTEEAVAGPSPTLVKQCPHFLVIGVRRTVGRVHLGQVGYFWSDALIELSRGHRASYHVRPVRVGGSGEPPVYQRILEGHERANSSGIIVG